MKVQSELYPTIELDCLSKNLNTIKAEISIQLFLPKNTFELFYKDSHLKKITPELKNEVVKLVFFLSTTI